MRAARRIRTFTPPSSMESAGPVPDICVIVRSDAGVYAHILDSRTEPA